MDVFLKNGNRKRNSTQNKEKTAEFSWIQNEGLMGHIEDKRYRGRKRVT